MSLDSRIRSAVDETLLTPVDLDRGLVALRRTRRRRAGSRVGAVIVVAALTLAVLLVDRRESTPEPVARHVRNGVLFSLTDGRVVQSGPGRLERLPVNAVPLGQFTFTRDGGTFLFAQGQELRAWHLASGQVTTLAHCPRHWCLGAAVDPRIERVATSHGSDIEVRDLGSTSRRRYPVGGAVRQITWSPDGRSLAFSTATPHPSISRLDLDSGRLTPLASITGEVDSALAWSPDGSTIAFAHRTGGIDRHPPYIPHISTFTLETVTAGDGTVRTLHALGRCYCLRSTPAVTWSPDGTWIAATLAGGHRVGGDIVEVHPDGSGWRRLHRGRFGYALAWRPLVTTDG